MVTQFNDGDEELEDRERFPAGPLDAGEQQPIIQLRLALPVAATPGMSALVRSFPPGGEASPAGETPLDERAADSARFGPLAELQLFLLANRAAGITWPLDPSPELAAILTEEERLRRMAIIDVRFMPEVDLARVAERLRTFPLVEEAFVLPGEAPPSHLSEPLLGSDDQSLAKQWYAFRIRAHRAWAFATGQDVVIADVDFGFLTTHQDLTNIEQGKAFNSHDGSSNVSQGTSLGHGTAVLGITGGARNGHGVLGIAYESALWPIQASKGTGPHPGVDKWARGIDYVVATNSQGRRKVVMLQVQTKSGTCYEMVASTREAIQQAIAHNVVVVVPAGNGQRDVSLNESGNTYPESGSILVGSTAFHPSLNPRAASSNFGSRLAVSAPGYGPSDLTCGPNANNNYRMSFGGTSGAAPKVAGACALMLQVNPSLSHQDVKTILVQTGTEVVTSPNRPAGVFLDVEAAVIMAH